MKKTLIFLLVLFLSCTDDEGNPCVYQPTLTTEAVTNITDNSATLNGTIDVTSDNCETPNNTEQGFVYSTEIQPTIEDIQVNVNGTNISTTLEGLTPNTTYYVRSFLTNALGEFYGNEMEFTTNEFGGCDGAPYPSIVYGTQEWTVENACHITYRDGTPIPEVTDNAEWVNLTTGAWTYYNNDPTKPRLYNWYAVMGIHDNDPNTPNKEFAPEGWHVPTDTEWRTLEEYLISNGYNYDGTTTENKIAKAMASTTGWNSSLNDFLAPEGTPGNDQTSNNSSGFNAFPEGFRFADGSFANEGFDAIFWSSTEYTEGNQDGAWYRYLRNFIFFLHSNHPNGNYKYFGFSVRFVRD